MTTYSVTLTEAEDKAMHIIAVDPAEWVSNVVKERARLAMEDIVASETARMIADPTVTAIPADKNQIVMEANIPTAAEEHARIMALSPGQI
jgi:hypothetical protein